MHAAPIHGILGFTLKRENPESTMQFLYSVWSLLQAAMRTLDRQSDHQDQMDAEQYLANSQSTAELEFRERNWSHSH